MEPCGASPVGSPAPGEEAAGPDGSPAPGALGAGSASPRGRPRQGARVLPRSRLRLDCFWSHSAMTYGKVSMPQGQTLIHIRSAEGVKDRLVAGRSFRHRRPPRIPGQAEQLAVLPSWFLPIHRSGPAGLPRSHPRDGAANGSGRTAGSSRLLCRESALASRPACNRSPISFSPRSGPRSRPRPSR